MVKWNFEISSALWIRHLDSTHIHFLQFVSYSDLSWFLLGTGIYHGNLLGHISSWSEMLLLWGIRSNTIRMTFVLGIYGNTKQMRSDRQKKSQPKVHAGEKLWPRGVPSPGGCWHRADRLCGQEGMWLWFPGIGCGRQRLERQYGSAPQTLPIIGIRQCG